MTGGDTAVQKAESSSHFKRNLVPLHEYATRQGISSDIVEQQGQLGVIQIRKFKGQKFVVDVSPEQLSEFENENVAETTGKPVVPRATTSSKIFTIVLAAVTMVIIVGLFWLYMIPKTKLDDLNAEYKSIQNRYNEMTSAHQSLKAMQEQLVSAKAEFARIQNRIAASKTDMEKIQGDLNKTKTKPRHHSVGTDNLPGTNVAVQSRNRKRPEQLERKQKPAGYPVSAKLRRRGKVVDLSFTACYCMLLIFR